MTQLIADWFEPEPDEHVILFLPDPRSAEVNQGAAGMVVTDRRIVFRNDEEHDNIPLDEPKQPLRTVRT